MCQLTEKQSKYKYMARQVECPELRDNAEIIVCSRNQISRNQLEKLRQYRHLMFRRFHDISLSSGLKI